MRIAMITENDPAGVSIQLTRAINRLTEHQCRLITTQIRYNFLFEKDIHVPNLDRRGLDELAEVLESSDIFHFHLLGDEDIPLGPYTPRMFLRKQRIVHHHHGHPDFRAHPGKYRQKYLDLGRKQLLVSTPDLLHKLPEAIWLPNPVPLDEPLYQPAATRAAGVRIAHSPTRRELKNTAAFIELVLRLQTTLPQAGIELELIENTLHADCLRRKQASHIVFDHMQGYYGVSSLEALSQGTPVIAGLDAWNQQTIRETLGCDRLPWVLAADASTLENALRTLILDPELRARIGEESRSFMERYWNERIIVERLLAFYATN